jgi:hypothetical protein
VDLYFLNRPPVRGVVDASQVQHAFLARPSGYTPLTRTLQQILSEKSAVLAEGRRLLCIICTDGQPTDDRGTVRIEEFTRLLQLKPQKVLVQIVACTDDDESVAYLNKIDQQVVGVDTSDDYHSERREILRAQGPGFQFSFGSYVVKTMLGPVDASFDKLDEGKGCSIA